MSAGTDLSVRPLGPEGLAEFLRFFDGEACADNAWWAGCYCNFYESLTQPADNPDPATSAFVAFRDRNRSEKAARIRAGLAHGFLASRDGKVVGWLNAQRSDAYASPRQFEPAFAEIPEGTGLLMCFVVAPGARRQRVASALLQAAVESFRAAGLRHAQGFARRPVVAGEGETFSTSNYHGTMSMYLENGFADVGSLGAYAVMRRSL